MLKFFKTQNVEVLSDFKSDELKKKICKPTKLFSFMKDLDKAVFMEKAEDSLLELIKLIKIKNSVKVKNATSKI